VYERAAPSLTFADSVRAEWQGKGRIVNQAASSPAPSAAPRRLTPVPVVPTRLPARVARSIPSNTLSPTTAEAELTPPARGAGLWGDRSVVLASELRAVKKTSKRVALWAAVGSALVASAFTFWAARMPIPGFEHGQLSAPAAATPREATPSNAEPTPAPTAIPAAATAAAVSAATTPTATAAAAVAVSTAKAPAASQPVRAVKRAKPAAKVAAAAPATDNPYGDDSSSDSKPSEAKASEAKASEPKPSAALTAPTLAAAIATAVSGAAPPAAPQPEAPSPGPASAATPGF
jgi:hypothetical protein